MKFKDIFLAGVILLASSFIPLQRITNFDIYSKGENFIGPRLKTGSIKVTDNSVDFSLLFNIYSMNLKKLNDSTYQETVKDNFIFTSKEEFFIYSFKNSSYALKDYFVIGGAPRKEKEVLIGNVFDRKYKTLIETIHDFEKGSLKDSAHFFVFGMPYSVGIKNIKEKENTLYICNLNGVIKQEQGDFIIFPYPTEIVAKNEEGKVTPMRFLTKSLNVRNKRINSIEGILKE
jgi:hypothetical protein